MKMLLRLGVVLCGAIVLCFGTTGCTTKEKEKGKDSTEVRKSDHDLIQGTWNAEGELRLVLTAETVTMQRRFDTGSSNNPAKAPPTLYKLDPSKKPKAIDITILSGKEQGTLLGIYDIVGDGDILRFCYSEDPRIRPPDFSRPPDFKDQPGINVYALKREKR